jgi:hypothetical protein
MEERIEQPILIGKDHMIQVDKEGGRMGEGNETK